MKYFSLLSLLFLVPFTFFSQEKKTIEAIRIETSPKIDGLLDDSVWKNIQPSNGFFMWQPGNEGSIPPEYQTEIKMAYDDNAVYVAAYMYDPNPENILTQFSQRDEVNVQADQFYIALNTYNDGINETRFYVTSAGTIGDSRVSQNGEDFNYDVVFSCKISKDNKGWYAEFKIPYNALRFPESETQNWSVNFYRRLHTKNETHTWNFIDNTTGNPTLYNGLVSGVKNINPPVRLTFYPFVQGVVSTFDGETNTDFKAGMDVKYGISDSFTLDATLIPDFGQAAFDEVRLNLGPFEQTFGENRAFFTEGIELFKIGDIFFSRRIGSSPTGSVEDLTDNETITDYPSSVNLLNAIKVSGRTKGGLGIGIFNAVTEKTYATIENTATGESRKVLIEPLSNYNILVLDQQFNKNSSVSLINTNVTRDGSFRDGNVTAGVFNISNNQNSYRLTGKVIINNLNDVDKPKTGYRTGVELSKIKGNFRFRLGHNFADENHDINDMGLSFRNNYHSYVAGISYQIFKPTKHFNTYRLSLTYRSFNRYKPAVHTGGFVSLDAFFLTKSRLAYGGNLSFSENRKDFFEPRVEGRFVKFSGRHQEEVWISTDYRKKFAIDTRLEYRDFYTDPETSYEIRFSPRYRFSDKLLVIASTGYSKKNKNIGYVSYDGNEIYFGQRDVTNFENTLTASYNFDSYKAIDLRFRNSWSTADYSVNKFWTLNEDGTRTETVYDIAENDPNTNFNIWNLDVSFRWRFAPGSEATLLYRNQLFNQDTLATLNYTDSLDKLFTQPAQHTISLRISYFIDYNNIKHFFKKKDS